MAQILSALIHKQPELWTNELIFSLTYKENDQITVNNHIPHATCTMSQLRSLLGGRHGRGMGFGWELLCKKGETWEELVERVFQHVSKAIESGNLLWFGDYCFRHEYVSCLKSAFTVAILMVSTISCLCPT
jgi:hypothetical protein